MQDDILNLLQH